MKLINFIRRHPVACFFVLAYVLAWGAIPWNSFFAPGALIAAVVVVLLTEGPRGLLHLGSRLIRWRVSWVWYAVAIGVPLFVHFASTSINVVLGASAPSLSLLTPWYGLPLALAMHIISPFGGPLMEEPTSDSPSPSSRRAVHDWRRRRSWPSWSPAGTPPLSSCRCSRPIRWFLTTLAVTFWYRLVAQSRLRQPSITLIAHGTRAALRPTACGGPVLISTAQLRVRRRMVPGRAGPAGAAPPVLDSPGASRSAGRGEWRRPGRHRHRSAVNQQSVGHEGRQRGFHGSPDPAAVALPVIEDCDGDSLSAARIAPTDADHRGDGFRRQGRQVRSRHGCGPSDLCRQARSRAPDGYGCHQGRRLRHRSAGSSDTQTAALDVRPGQCMSRLRQGTAHRTSRGFLPATWWASFDTRGFRSQSGFDLA